MSKPKSAAARQAKAPASKHWRGTFLAHLAATSNVTAAALAANITLGYVYRLRREDATFRAAWMDALSEGYDNLEMELLQHLRGLESAAADDAAPKRKFDTATAFRCLTAHREAVTREKGRRTLADEVATIAAINEKIDRLRLNAAATDKAVRKARRASRPAAVPSAVDGN